MIESIRSTKEKVHFRLSINLSDPCTTAKTYWSMLKTFENGRTFLLITALLVNEKFVSNLLLQKANIFNEFFNQ